MERRIDNLKPKFLKQFDNYLLENHPLVWMSKIHYVATFTVVVYFMFSIQIFVGSANLANASDIEFLPIISIFFVLPVLGYWVYHLYVSNISKNFGTQIKNFYAKQLMLIFLGTTMILSIPSFIFYAQTTKYLLTISRAEIENDMFILNSGNAYFPSNAYDYGLTNSDENYTTPNYPKGMWPVEFHYQGSNPFSAYNYYNGSNTEQNFLIKKAPTNKERKKRINDYVKTMEKYGITLDAQLSYLEAKKYTMASLKTVGNYNYEFNSQKYEVTQDLNMLQSLTTFKHFMFLNPTFAILLSAFMFISIAIALAIEQKFISVILSAVLILLSMVIAGLLMGLLTIAKIYDDSAIGTVFLGYLVVLLVLSGNQTRKMRVKQMFTNIAAASNIFTVLLIPVILITFAVVMLETTHPDFGPIKEEIFAFLLFAGSTVLQTAYYLAQSKNSRMIAATPRKS